MRKWGYCYIISFIISMKFIILECKDDCIVKDFFVFVNGNNLLIWGLGLVSCIKR